MTITFSEVTELKKEIKDKFPSAGIHFHDGCGGQYFTIDQPDEALLKCITAYFAKKNLTVLFSEDGSQFTLKKDF